ncbi:ATP-binding protein, partial [Candidatus Marithioploca araucensis]|nr:ATP-binding protein [Candidatus Marithioploca araucensis]
NFIMSNPFFYGDPIPPKLFVGRDKELRRIISRIITGQSTAIIGEPRSGKTSLLLYLAEPTLCQTHYGHGEQLLFSFLDVQTLSDQFNQSQFWEHALHPLHEKIITSRRPNTPVAKAYKNCKREGFSVSTLERLFEKMQQDGQHIVVMIDEFDVLLNHAGLNHAAFFGTLRSLTSRTRVLSLLIASRLSLSNLNSQTQQFNITGSPYFNVFQEIILGPLADEAVKTLLNQADAHFNEDDHRFITKVAGAHPYLLQATASALWENYEDGEPESIQRYTLAGQQLYENAKLTFDDTWRLWEPMTRMAVMTIALNQWNKQDLLRDMGGFKPELRRLEKQGFILRQKDYQKRWQQVWQSIFNGNSSGYLIYPEVLLWWLADELAHAARDEQSYNEWIRTQELDGILTQEQKQQLNQA